MKRLNDELLANLKPIQLLPKALQALISYYTSGEGQALLEKLSLSGEVLCTGSGFGLFSARYAAHQCLSGGVLARYLSMNELTGYSARLFSGNSPLLIFGSAIPEDLPGKFPGSQVVQIGAEPNSVDGCLCLPIFSKGVAAETQIVNEMALAWWLAGHLAGNRMDSEKAKLQLVRQRIQLMADGAQAYFNRCADLLKYSPRWILVGPESQLPCLEFTASTLARRAGRLVPWTFSSEFEQNYTKVLDPDAAVIHFRAGDDLAFEQVLDRAEESGVVVVNVIDGFFWPHRSEAAGKSTVDLGVSSLLNIMAGQMLALSTIFGL